MRTFNAIQADGFGNILTVWMGIILADAIFRTLEHELKDFHRGDTAKVQMLSLQYNLNLINAINDFAKYYSQKLL